MASSIAVSINFNDNVSPKLKALLSKSPGAISAGVEALAMQGRDLMVEYAQAGHPSHPNVVTGRLAGSMQYMKLPSANYALVGSNADYAPYVEYGHMSPSWGYGAWHFVPAYPWFRPAINDLQSDIGDQVFKEAVMEALGNL